ncbi:MAG TPA: hypothetical protein VEG28_01485 [Dehalococcoidia bacterium]|nr:hypothetical protein [Dehalococcoidia bacterium]
MDTLPIIIAIIVFLILLVLIAYSDEINTFMERKLDEASTYATEIQLLLGALLGAIFTELWRAASVMDWLKIAIYVAVMLLTILAILDVRARSVARQRGLDSQYTRNLTALFEDSVRRVLKEDRKGIKKEIKEALKEDREERERIIVPPIKKTKKGKTKQ